VTVHAWPWLKSQQAGFSHCLLRAAPVCTWVLFADVDEFLRPGSWQASTAMLTWPP